ncbi:N-6 DNA methylase [Streptomyces sp. cg40]|uniref:N-6 DNA methylase n=1 Tax=Streptomyces sp. cg40 TaxID=3419764 RepID=UPI003D07F4FA
MTTDRVEVTSADIARIADVRPTAVSNWRRRHEDFPQPVGGTERSPRFDLAEVEAWLLRERKAPQIPPGQRLWQAFDSVRSVMPADDALGMAGTLLLHLHEHPATPAPTRVSDCEHLLREAERTLSQARGARAGVTALLAHCPRHEFGPRQLQLLSAAAEAAAANGAAATFDELCARHLSSGPRAGFSATPPALADLMVHLAGPVHGTLLDPACGSGTLLLAAAEHGYQRVQGQELNPSLARVTAVRLAFRASTADPEQVRAAVVYDVHADDFLRSPVYPRKASAVVTNPPFADRTWGYEDLADSVLWEYGVPPRAESELAWIQQALAHVVPGAPVVLLMPPAAAVRPSGRRIRAELLRRGALRAVFSLPPGYAAHYALPLQLWVLHRPDPTDAPRPAHILVADAGDSQDPAALVRDIWDTYSAAPEAFTTRPGVARTVPLADLLDDADVTPRRHLPQLAQPGASLKELTATRSAFEEAAEALLSRLPSLPPSPPAEWAETRSVLLHDLIRSGAVVLHHPTPARKVPLAEESPGPGEARFLTAADLATGRTASNSGPAPEDPLRSPPIRVGDILMPAITRNVVARVATEEDAGSYPSASVHHIRITDPELLDPWFFAGYLSSSEGSRQASTATSTLGVHARIDPRRVRLPLLPIEQQRTYGEVFRSISEFTRVLHTVHDLGSELARDATDALAAGLHPTDHPQLLTPAGERTD